MYVSYNMYNLLPLPSHTHTSTTQTLRGALDHAGLTAVQIVANDNGFEPISSNILHDPELSKAVSIIG